ncbi:hypothetical protein [Spongiimicrobium sp. 3-5]|uniref:hypothetical protein n=1 Tax=Spongiimicrobium sp. 3-5 TaxID=3332596 RepID=UPI00397EA454
MRANKKIRAGALQFVLFIGAIIAVLLMTFVLISHVHTRFNKKADLTTAVIKRTNDGFNPLQTADLPDNTILGMAPGDESNITVTTNTEYWGVFKKRTATGIFKKVKFIKTAFIGKAFKDIPPALYIKDTNRPLVIAGKSKIIGDAHLPQQGIRMGNIGGNGYRYSNLIFGNKKVSSAMLPKLDVALLKNIENCLESVTNLAADVVELGPGLMLKNSFDEKTQYILGDIIELENMHLAGNVIISATEKILVTPTATLQDVLLIAPEIHIKDGVNGNFQAIANNRIRVGKNCRLAYPTALVVKYTEKRKKENKHKDIPNIEVGARSDIRGVLLHLEETEERLYSPQIKIEENARITGEIYCTKNLELKGEVIGKVTTETFIALENGSIYQNHLYMGQINSTLLPDTYAGLSGREAEEVNVMKWLY